MILSSETILRMQAAPSQSQRLIVEGFDPDQSERIEGGAYDLRLGQLHEVGLVNGGGGFIGVRRRFTPNAPELEPARTDEGHVFVLMPLRPYLGVTIESVRSPEGYRARVVGRTTLFRCGVLLMCADVAPGYVGPLTFGLANLTQAPVRIQVGARIAAITWETMDSGTTDQYAGPWQGGRVSTQGAEVRPW